MNQPYKVDTRREVPVGTYPAITGGCMSEFKVGTVMYLAVFTNGVRGFGYSDAITVSQDGEIYSSVLAAFAVGLKRAIWRDV